MILDFRFAKVLLGGSKYSSINATTKAVLAVDAGAYIYGIPLYKPMTSTEYTALTTTTTSIAAYCDSTGASFYYKELINTVENKRVIYSTRCPNHYSVQWGLEW